MTFDPAQIQTLIDGIDEALNKTSPRLPWVMSNETAQQRQVLEQTREYLLSLQQASNAQSLQPLEQPPERFLAALPPTAPLTAMESPSESAQQVLQAVLQEMNYWRVNMLQPLRAEVDSLQRQRELLTQEIRQLDGQRQQQGISGQPSQQALMEFLQSAMVQMQANLSRQMTQMVANQLPTNPTGQAALPGATGATAGGAIDSQSWAALSPAERLEYMQKMQAQSDHLMLKLDSTLQVIFESLNRNVQTYEASLTQGLNRMHSLGQQGEAMFAFLVSRLAEQLGREASTFLQSSAPPHWQQPDPSALPPSAPVTGAATGTVTGAATGLESMPELQSGEPKPFDFSSQSFHQPARQPDPTRSASFVPAIPFDLTEEVLDIAELSELEAQPPMMQPAPGLEGLDRSLSQLDLMASPPNAVTEAGTLAAPVTIETLFTGDQPLPVVEPLSEPFSTNLPAATPSDLDSALDLLNQLSAEMQAGLPFGEEPPLSSVEAGTVGTNETELIATPDSLYDDAFYSNLMQDTAVEPLADPLLVDPSLADSSLAQPFLEPSTPGVTEPEALSALTLEQEWFGGLGDPATHLPPLPTASQSAPPQLEFPDRTVGQTLETSLLSSSAPAPTSTDLFADFSAAEITAPASNLDAPEADLETIETISSLTELLSDLPDPTAAPSEPLPVAEASVEAFRIDWGQEAGPDGNLLATFPNLAANSEPLPAALDSSDPPAVTIEGLEGLFADLPDFNPASESPASSMPSHLSAQPPAPEVANPDGDLFERLKAAFDQDAGLSITADPQADPTPDLDPNLVDPADPEKKK